jgi:DNA topoisomerase-3
VHEFERKFFSEYANIKVTSVTGHIYCRDFPKNYSDWYKVDPYSLFDAPTLKRESNPEASLVQHLQTEAQGCDYLVLWLDCDKEGENICFEVLEITKDYLNNGVSLSPISGQAQNVFRAKFSSITKQDITYAYET